MIVLQGVTLYIPCAINTAQEAAMDMVMKTEVIEKEKLLEGLPVVRQEFN